ncbi:MAG: family 10 glycosylhydrolase [Oscillospiraceae bacterium]|nr:family 10 glycosylhydrolase [Oscillospiraceae bacterium]
MKKEICFFLSLIMIFALASCSVNEEPVIIENEVVLGQSSSESNSFVSESSQSSSESSSASESSESENSSESSSFSSSSKTETSSSSSSSQIISSESSSSGSENSSSVSSSESSSGSQSSESSSSEEKPVQNTYAPSGETKAVWISYLEYQSILQGKTKKQFTNSIKSMFDKLSEDGFNTVFVHVRSHSDAMYDSDIFPWSVYCTGTEGKDPGFDPLEIMVSEAHSADLKIEAWINPYRIKGSSDTSKISKSSPAYEWLDTGKVIVLDNKIYYNPADEEVIDLIVSGVKEIVGNYDVDGIHFDDYFYPTTAESFDKEYYKEYKNSGGKLDLASWRRQNVNTLIKKVYSAIKAINSSCRFGVSPTGNMDQNYNTHYCDVNTWVTSKGYVDYICPQIYFGFNNKSRPYLDVLSEFGSMITRSEVELIVGLAAYKAGAEDTYAGDSGKKEWINNNDILARQIVAAREEERYSGFALYRYDSLYNPVSGVKNAVKSEMENLLEIM